MVHILLKPGLENFEYYFASMWDECSCAVVQHAEYIMWNAGLDEAQSGIKFAWRIISNLWYTDITTLVAELKN